MPIIERVNQLSLFANATFFFYFQQVANKAAITCDDFSCFISFEMQLLLNYKVVYNYGLLAKM